MRASGRSILTLVAVLGTAGVVLARPPSEPLNFWAVTGNPGTSPRMNFLGTTDAQDLVLATNGTEAVRVNSTGQVGIGTTNPGAIGISGPAYSLDVRAPNPFSPDTVVSFSSDTGQAGLFLHSLSEEAYLSFGKGVDFASSTILLDRNTDALHFCVADTANCQFATQVRVTIQPSGEVGIGTKTPRSALQVVGYAQLDLTAGAPPSADCDEASERGRMKVDGAAGLLYVCVDSGWAAK